jgi:hypothetical protein
MGGLSNRLGKDEIELKGFLDRIVKAYGLQSKEPFREESAVLTAIEDRFKSITAQTKQGELIRTLADFARYSLDTFGIRVPPDQKNKFEKSLLNILRKYYELDRDARIERELNKALS